MMELAFAACFSSTVFAAAWWSVQGKRLAASKAKLDDETAEMAKSAVLAMNEKHAELETRVRKLELGGQSRIRR